MGPVLYKVGAAFRTQAPGSDKVVTKSPCGSHYGAPPSTGKASVGSKLRAPRSRNPLTLDF